MECFGVFVNNGVIDEIDDNVCASVRVGECAGVVVRVCVILLLGLELNEIIVDGVFNTDNDCICDIRLVTVCCIESVVVTDDVCEPNGVFV